MMLKPHFGTIILMFTMVALITGCANAQTTADPNASASTKAELAYLYGLTSKSSGHVVQSTQEIDNVCDNNDCPGEETLNYATNGNHYPGGVGTGYCNGSWEGASPMCTFDNGSGSSTLNQLVKQAWARGSLIQMDMHLPNPYDNWQNNPIQPSVPPPQICPGAGAGTPEGVSGDCTSNSNMDTYAQQMMQSGTTPNAQWNSMLDSFAAGLQNLQNAGVVVILRPFHESNGNWFWWSSPGEPTKEALWRYVENYFNNVKGLHNIIWEYCIVDSAGGLVGYPGRSVRGLDGDRRVLRARGSNRRLQRAGLTRQANRVCGIQLPWRSIPAGFLPS